MLILKCTITFSTNTDSALTMTSLSLMAQPQQKPQIFKQPEGAPVWTVGWLERHTCTPIFKIREYALTCNPIKFLIVPGLIFQGNKQFPVLFRSQPKKFLKWLLGHGHFTLKFRSFQSWPFCLKLQPRRLILVHLILYYSHRQ